MRRLFELAILAMSCAVGNGAFAQSGADAVVLKVEQDFDLAKVRNDVAALDRIVDDGYVGINQWGARRTKAEIIDLFRDFKTDKLIPSNVTVRVSGDFATVDGAMAESGPGGAFTYLFVRVYVKREGTWKLLSSTQLIPSDPR
jgi:Domain of unknown function (DUF4440)